MQQSIRVAVAAVAGMFVTQAAHAATVSGASPALFQQEAVVSGTVLGSGSSQTVRIARGTSGESRGIYEFKLPTLPTGASFSSVAFNYSVSETNSTTNDASQLRFTTYAGNGTFEGADINRTGGTLLSPKLFDTGPYSQILNPSANTLAGRFLGINAQQESFNFRTGISRGNLPAPTISYVVNVPDSGTLTFAPTFDVLANSSTGSPAISDGGFSINSQEFVNTQRRGVLEYDLSLLPDGARITGARIDFVVNGLTSDSVDGGPEPRIYGYGGNGTAEPSDYFQTANLLATGTTVGDLGAYSVTLNAAAIRAILAGGSSTLGLLVRGSADGNQFGFSTIENGTPAQLSLTYAVPEPASLAALAAALGVVAARRRRA